jgi:O-6-methylguanine DNA methyltransferase
MNDTSLPPAPRPLRRRVLPHTPLGPLTLVASEDGLRELRFGLPHGPDVGVGGGDGGSGEAVALMEKHLEATINFLEEALQSGPREDPPRPPLDLEGHSSFRLRVWDMLQQIPRGGLRSYGDLSNALSVGSAQAIGQAVGANPLPILIPCHRVVAESLRLGGYSGGLNRKVQLLALEGISSEGEDPAARLSMGGALELDL